MGPPEDMMKAVAEAAGPYPAHFFLYGRLAILYGEEVNGGF